MTTDAEAHAEVLKDRLEVVELRVDLLERRFGTLESRFGLFEQGQARAAKSDEEVRTGIDILKVSVSTILSILEKLGFNKP